MTACPGACGSPLHEKTKSQRQRIDALYDELRAAYDPSTKSSRRPTAAEQTRITTTEDAYNATLKEARETMNALTEHHENIACERATSGGKSARMTSEQLLASVSTSTSGIYAPRSGEQWAAKTREQMGTLSRDPFSTPSKALSTPGHVIVPTVFDPAPVREGERPTAIRQLIPVQNITTDQFGYLRQTVRVNRAAPVARGRVKPTSTYTLERVEDRCRTIAHLSEPIARQDLEDSADLTAFLDAELRYGVTWASEDQMVNGDGTGEELTGILATAGITGQPWAQDLLTTTRHAVTVQQQLGNTPTGWALNPADWERLELLRENGTTGALMLAAGPIDRAAQRLWGLPVVAADVVPTGVGILGDFAGSARIYQREQALVTWSDAVYRPAENGDPASTAFARNELVMRVEERVGLAILRPAAFTSLDLTAA